MRKALEVAEKQSGCVHEPKKQDSLIQLEPFRTLKKSQFNFTAFKALCYERIRRVKEEEARKKREQEMEELRKELDKIRIKHKPRIGRAVLDGERSVYMLLRQRQRKKKKRNVTKCGLPRVVSKKNIFKYK